MSDLETTGFDAFYALYPRREKKGTARPAYEKALKKVNHEVIMEGVRRYLAKIDKEKIERKYIGLPASWLNAEQWADGEFDLQPTLGDHAAKKSEIKGPTDAQLTTKDLKARYAAAEAWWLERGNNPALFREYEHRSRVGIPTAANMTLINLKAIADGRQSNTTLRNPLPGATRESVEVKRARQSNRLPPLPSKRRQGELPNAPAPE
jgi:hypothetical protein